MQAQEYLKHFEVEPRAGTPRTDEPDQFFDFVHAAYSPETVGSEQFSASLAEWGEETRAKIRSFYDQRRMLQASGGLVAEYLGLRAEVAATKRGDFSGLIANIEDMDYAENVQKLYEGAMFASRVCLIDTLVKLGAGALIDATVDPKKAAREARNVMGQHSDNTARAFEPYTATIRYEGTLVGRNFTMTGIDSETRTETKHFEPIRRDEDGNIVGMTEEQADTQDYIAATLLEVDAFVALTEWVKHSKLPYLPIVAPKTMEAGKQLWLGGKNAHSDILLLGLGANEILPIQMKMKHRDERVSTYIDEMIFLTEGDIATQESEQVIIRSPLHNTAKIGHNNSVILGDLTKRWIDIHRAPKNKKQKLRKTLNPLLDRVYSRLDSKVLPHLKSKT